MKRKFADFTEAQFVDFMQQIFTANKNGTPDEILDELLDQFRQITEHPDGSDLIYWPESEEQCTPEGITETVKKWREANGLPSFKFN
ncbi:bacteriocin immunity protein [Pseudomonas sp. EggHat1]|uniref:bacteriocin immunity protein n=1 Tax=Pseudomonas sp. EggHat1 TaxID=2761624 RepID=UPI0018686FC3|nr:bacteriocin immunity protein [Pseudomonas sp. EggHat1]